MYYCSNCGAQIDEHTQCCANCGAQIQQSSQDTTVLEQPAYSYTPPLSADNFQMKWYKFLIYFSLFAGAFLNFINGANMITGNIYFTQTNGQVTADMVYGMYGSGLKIMDVLYGFALLLIAVFSIYTRMRLAKFKANAPMCIDLLYGVPAALSVLYNLIISVICDMQTFTSSVIVSVVSSVVVLLLNHSYFKKRKVLFVN